ncbi:MAG: hypothetical protein RLZ94_1256 [Actinomycetota bacterium]
MLADAGWTVLDAADAAGQPALVLWDLLPSADARDVADVVRQHPDWRLLVLVGGPTADELGALVSAGARGAVDRDLDEAALMSAAHAVADGRTVVNAGTRSSGATTRPPDLTRREFQVLALLGEGRTNHQIAEALVISENTVKNHVRRLYEKLQVRSRTEAVVKAARWGLVRLGEDGG